MAQLPNSPSPSGAPSNKSASKPTPDPNSQSIYLEGQSLGDLGTIHVYPRSMTNSEIDYDLNTAKRGQTPEDYYVNQEPTSMLKKSLEAVGSYWSYGQEAIKLLAIAPDVAMGFSKDISPEELSKTYKSWYDLWAESPVGGAIQKGAYSAFGVKREEMYKSPGRAAIPWFLTEFVPAELVDWGTRPSGWIGAYGIEKFGPPIINKVISRLPENVRSTLLKDIFQKGVDLTKQYETLGLQPNAPISEVRKAYRSLALKYHPDRFGGAGEEFIKIGNAYSDIVKYQNGVLNKFFRMFQESKPRQSKPKFIEQNVLSNKTGTADFLPDFQTGDLAKMGKDTVKVVKNLGDKIMVNRAGKVLEVSANSLAPHPKGPHAEAMKKAKEKAKAEVKPAEKKTAPEPASVISQYGGQEKARGILAQYSGIKNRTPAEDQIVKDISDALKAYEPKKTPAQAGGSEVNRQIDEQFQNQLSHAEGGEGYFKISPKTSPGTPKPKKVAPSASQSPLTTEGILTKEEKAVEALGELEKGLKGDKNVDYTAMAKQVKEITDAMTEENMIPEMQMLMAKKIGKYKPEEMEDYFSKDDLADAKLGKMGPDEADAMSEYLEDYELIDENFESEAEIIKQNYKDLMAANALAGNKTFPPEPPAPPAPAAAPAPEPKGPMAINPKHIDMDEEQIVALTKELKGELENQMGRPLTHAEVLEATKKAYVFQAGVSREETLKFAAQMTRTRQKLAFLSKEIKKNPGNLELAKEYRETLKIVANMATDIGRSLNYMAIDALPVEERIKNNVIKKLEELGVAGEELDKAIANLNWDNPNEVAEFYRKFVPSTFFEQLNEFSYINILSGPLTHIKNLFSNILQLGFSNPGARLLSGRGGEIAPFFKGVKAAVPSAVEAASMVMQGKKFVERPDVANLPTKAKWIDYATLGVGKYIPRALEASDILVRTVIYEGERLALRKRYGPDKPQAEIDKEAAELAEYYVYRQPLDPSNTKGQGEILSAIDRLTSKVYQIRKDFYIQTPLGEFRPAEWFIRFVQTPMNIFKQGIEYSPLGFGTIWQHKDPQGQIGKAMLGSLVFGYASYLAARHRTTWATPKDQSERALANQAKWQPYSFDIGPDKNGNPIYISYGQLGHLGIPIAMAAALHHYQSDSRTALADTEMEKAAQTLTGFMRFYSQQSYLEGMGNFVRWSQGDDQALKNIVTTMPEQMIPLSSLTGWVNGIVDPIYRQPKKGLNMEAIVDNLQKKLPLSSQFVPPARDLRMQPVQNTERFINAVSPLRIRVGDKKWTEIYSKIKKGQQMTSKAQRIAGEKAEKAMEKRSRK